MDKASEPLFALQPVTFRYKKEIEDVEKVNPDLVVHDNDGKRYNVP